MKPISAEALRDRISALEKQCRRLEKQAAAAKRKELYYRSVLAGAHEGLVVIDPDYRITDVNDAFLSATGYLRESVIGRHCYEISHGYNQPCQTHGEHCALNEVIRTGEPSQCLHEHIRRNGSRTWITVHLSPLKDETGKTVSVIQATKDVSDVMSAQEKLILSENKLRGILKDAPVGIGVVTDRNIVWANEKLCEITGYDMNALEGQSSRKLYPDAETFNRVGRERFRQIQMRGTCGVETRWRRKDGVIIDVLLNLTPKDVNQPSENVVFSVLDISEKRALENRLQQIYKMEAIGTLAGGIAHDFNNILFPIVGFAEMIVDSPSDEGFVKKSATEILHAAGRAQDLVKQILTFARKSAQEKKPVRVSPIIKESLKLLRASLPSTIRIDWNLSVESEIILADPTQIHQILMNLCTNAYHAMEDTGGVLTVSLENERPAETGGSPDALPASTGYLVLRVTDSGKGIHPDIQEKIFDPYFTTKAHGKGTGMGLSVVHGIVKSHGGHISVESTPELGTTVAVYLPLLALGVENPDAEPDEPVPGGAEHVVFVDDEPQVVKMATKLLNRLGYRVTAFEDSTEALAFLRESHTSCDLLITDWTMPRMTGDKLAGSVKGFAPHLPVILCTGRGEAITERAAGLQAADRLLTKPVGRNELARLIRELIDTNG